jgi:hypothetical protein
MADLLWSLLCGVSLVAGIVCSAVSAWAVTRLSIPILPMITASAGFGMALWAGVHVHG